MLNSSRDRRIAVLLALAGLALIAGIDLAQAQSPLGIGAAEDIGWAVVYLASDRSPYTTGSEMVIDGGHIVR